MTVGSATGFATGAQVLFHQTQAATGPVGVYEFATVAGVAGVTLTLTRPLVNSYVTDATHAAQVLVVPQYTTVTVSAGATLTAPAWNGSVGGILVFDAASVVNAGNITMSANGFRGGSTALVCGSHCVIGHNGESAIGVGAALSITANGAGGGGGAQGQDCGMGGGGGYATAGGVGVNNTTGACIANSTNSAGGVVDGTTDLATEVLFGGGGGEGGRDEDGGNPGAGGAGGGLVFIRTGTITVSGTITSAGGIGGSGNNNCAGGCGMGGGGGGAGGAIRLQASTTAALGTNLVTAIGVVGGTCTCGATNSGTGGNGRIGVLAPAAGITGTTNPVADPE